MKQSCSYESLPSSDTEIIRSMSAFPSKTPSSFDLLQNCDLPPPLKVFPGLSPTAKLYGLMGDQEDEHGDRVGLLKALQLSQTRAREAEKRIQGFAKERECLSDAVLRESLQGLAYRNWVRVLESQVSILKLKLKEQEVAVAEVAVAEVAVAEVAVAEVAAPADVAAPAEVTAGWVFSWAIPLGIAGIGFAFAFSFLF